MGLTTTITGRIRESIEGLDAYIEECSKIINNPETPQEERKMVLRLRREYYITIAIGIKAIEKIKQHNVPNECG